MTTHTDTTPFEGERHAPLATVKRLLGKQLGDFSTIEEIKQQNRRKGQHFFSDSTMRFFGSRVGHRVYGGCYFITSEKDNYGNQARRYTVRVAYSDGDIDTMGDFQAFATRAQAVAYVKFCLTS